MKEAFGGLSSDWKEGINWASVRRWRLARAREAMSRHGLGALLLFYDENMRYVSSTFTPGCSDRAPAMAVSSTFRVSASGSKSSGIGTAQP